MRLGRIKFTGAGYYHLISRVVDGSFKIIGDERNNFMSLMYQAAKFSGVRILDFAIMSNHVHLIVFASGICLASEEEIIERYGELYGKEPAQDLKKRWKHLREIGCEYLVEEEKSGFRKRIEDRGTDLLFEKGVALSFLIMVPSLQYQ